MATKTAMAIKDAQAAESKKRAKELIDEKKKSKRGGKTTAATENPALEFVKEIQRVNKQIHKTTAKLADLPETTKETRAALKRLNTQLDKTITEDTAPLFKVDGAITRPTTKKGQHFSPFTVQATGAALIKGDSSDLIRPSKSNGKVWTGGKITAPILLKGEQFGERGYVVIGVLKLAGRGEGRAVELLPLYTVDEWKTLNFKSHVPAAGGPLTGTVVKHRGKTWIIGPEQEGIVIDW